MRPEYFNPGDLKLGELTLEEPNSGDFQPEDWKQRDSRRRDWRRRDLRGRGSSNDGVLQNRSHSPSHSQSSRAKLIQSSRKQWDVEDSESSSLSDSSQHDDNRCHELLHAEAATPNPVDIIINAVISSSKFQFSLQECENFTREEFFCLFVNVGTSVPPEEAQTSRPEANEGEKRNEVHIQQAPLKKLICPYYRHNWRAFKDDRTCRGPGFPDISRLKQHLYRRHKLIQCPRCYSTFSSADLLKNHPRELTGCTRRSPVALNPLHGFTEVQHRQLRDRTGYSKLTDEEKWHKIYHILFPEPSKHTLPLRSPYHTDNNELQQQINNEFFDSLSANVQRLVRTDLHQFISENAFVTYIDIEDQVEGTVQRAFEKIKAEHRSTLLETTPKSEPLHSYFLQTRFAAYAKVPPGQNSSMGPIIYSPDPKVMSTILAQQRALSEADKPGHASSSSLISYPHQDATIVPSITNSAEVAPSSSTQAGASMWEDQDRHEETRDFEESFNFSSYETTALTYGGESSTATQYGLRPSSTEAQYELGDVGGSWSNQYLLSTDFGTMPPVDPEVNNLEPQDWTL